jgi:hypothetical protein
MARGRQQRTVWDRLIPREVWEADEARRRARRDRGVDSDESTDDKENEANDRRNNDPEVPADPVDPEDEDSIVDTIEAVLRQSTIAMFRRVLIFSDGAATSHIGFILSATRTLKQ